VARCPPALRVIVETSNKSRRPAETFDLASASSRPALVGFYPERFLAHSRASFCHERYGGLPTPLEAEDIWADLWHEEAHNSLDGNGRTGRLIINLLLGRLGYPPAIIYKRDRERYLRAMRRADRSEYGPLAELIARGVTANLYRFVVPAVAGPAKLVPLTSLAKPTLTEGALRAAAVRGRLRAVRGDDGRWRSSRKWVDQYEATKHVRQPGREEWNHPAPVWACRQASLDLDHITAC